MQKLKFKFEKLLEVNQVIFTILSLGYLTALQIWKPAALLFRNCLLLPAVFAICCNFAVVKKIMADRVFQVLIFFFASSLFSLYPFELGVTTLSLILNWIGAFILSYYVCCLIEDKIMFIAVVCLIPIVVFCIAHLMVEFDLLDFYFIYNEHNRLIMGLCAPTRLGLIYAINISLSFAYIFVCRRSHLKILFAVMALAYFYMLITTGTRGALLAFLITIILLLMIQIRKIRLLYLLTGAGAFATIFIIYIGYIAPHSLKSRLMTIVSFSEQNEIIRNSLPSRVGIWKLALKSFDKPFKGVGYGRFQEHYAEQVDKFGYIIDMAPKDAHVLKSTSNGHNFFIHLFVENGILGVLTLGFVFMLIVCRGFFCKPVIPFSACFLTAFLTLQLNYNLNTLEIGSYLFSLAGISSAVYYHEAN